MTIHLRPEEIDAAIAELPERGRAVFVLVGVYGYPHEEAAGMLDMATGTSKAHFHQEAFVDIHDLLFRIRPPLEEFIRLAEE